MHNITLRKRVHEILDIKFRKRDKVTLYINIGLSILITVNTLAIILHTVPSLREKYDRLFTDFEMFSVIIFTIEYFLRIWSCVEKTNYEDPIKGRLKFAFSNWGLIDLLSILPFYISFFSTDFGFVRILRLLRILRLFRYSKYFHAISVIVKVVKDKKEELLLSMSFCMVLLLISSSLVYFVEHNAQPTVFKSIPDALWWGVNAMTTVGYGDMHPITPLGKVLGGLMAILGVCVFALPTGILAAGFNDHIHGEKHKHTHVKCPHCGESHYLLEK
jgi:voltage-gated potassium channel